MSGWASGYSLPDCVFSHFKLLDYRSLNCRVLSLFQYLGLFPSTRFLSFSTLILSSWYGFPYCSRSVHLPCYTGPPSASSPVAVSSLFFVRQSWNLFPTDPCSCRHLPVGRTWTFFFGSSFRPSSSSFRAFQTLTLTAGALTQILHIFRLFFFSAADLLIFVWVFVVFLP